MPDYNDPQYLLKAISYNIKRIADSLESQMNTQNKLPTSMSESYQYNPPSTAKQTTQADCNESFREFLRGLK